MHTKYGGNTDHGGSERHSDERDRHVGPVEEERVVDRHHVRIRDTRKTHERERRDGARGHSTTAYRAHRTGHDALRDQHRTVRRRIHADRRVRGKCERIDGESQDHRRREGCDEGVGTRGLEQRVRRVARPERLRAMNAPTANATAGSTNVAAAPSGTSLTVSTVQHGSDRSRCSRSNAVTTSMAAGMARVPRYSAAAATPPARRARKAPPSAPRPKEIA